MTRAGGKATRLTDHERSAIAELVRERLGLTFPTTRSTSLDAGVERALATLDETPGGLLRRLAVADPVALEALATELTVGESYFLRDRPHFVVVERVACTNPRPRFWSAGCAAGEEPYSMAIVALEANAEAVPDILATDLNPRHLERAREGVYGSWAFRGAPRTLQDTWFHADQDRWIIDERVRRCVRFELSNLIEDARADMAPMDVIFCRNVLMYLSPTAVERVARRLAAALSRDGWLVTGPSDPLLEIDELIVDQGLGFFAYRRAEPMSKRASSSSSMAAAQPYAPQIFAATPAELPAPAIFDVPATRQAMTIPEPVSVPLPAPPRSTANDVEKARALADAGDHAASLALLGSSDATQTDLLVLRAIVRQELGDLETAARDAEAALLFDRSLAIAHVIVAGARIDRGDSTGALRAIRNARRSLAAVPPGALVPLAGGAIASDVLATCNAIERRARTAESSTHTKVEPTRFEHRGRTTRRK